MNHVGKVKTFKKSVLELYNNGVSEVSDTVGRIVKDIRQGGDVSKYMDDVSFVCVHCGAEFPTEKKFIAHHSHRKWVEPNTYSEYYMDDMDIV